MCPTCKLYFANQRALDRHKADEHDSDNDDDDDNNNTLPREDPPTFPGFSEAVFSEGYDETERGEMIELYQRYWGGIRTHYTTERRVQDRYNVRLETTNVRSMRGVFLAIMMEQTSRFKVNVSFGFILRHTKNNTFRYFHPSQNIGRVLERPRLVGSIRDMNKFIEEVSEKDILEWARQQRPNSKWVVEVVTNMTVYVNKMPRYVQGVGCVGVELPKYIRTNKGVQGLVRTRQGRLYNDKLCLFRCIAVHKGDRRLGNVLALFRRFVGPTVSEKRFKGVKLSELKQVEDEFKLNIQVYKLEQKRGHRRGEKQVAAKLVRRSLMTYEDTMCLNLYKKHFSYIRDLPKYSDCYSCPKCGKLFPKPSRLQKHEKTCTGKVRFVFPGGMVSPQKSVFQKLEDYCISVDERDRYYPYRATFDIETMCQQEPEGEGEPQSSSKKLTWRAKHVLLSVSVCSNVPDYEQPKCLVSEGSEKSLIDRLMQYLNEISDKASSLLLAKFEQIFEQIDEKIGDLTQRERSVHNSGAVSPNDCPLAKIKEELERYLTELVCLGFHSGSYDINVLKKVLFGYFVSNDQLKHVIKKQNRFMSIRTGKVNFLDIQNYLSPGYSYSQMLKAYDCDQKKGFFCYDYVTSLDKLSERSLPPHEAFYSHMKASNITADEYGYCQRVWRDENMQTLEDFLVWYNNLDTVPFLEAAEKMHSFYRGLGLDAFKDAVSLPGLTYRFMVKNATKPSSVFFSKFNERHKDLYSMFKDSIVGGPSIVFHRYHSAGETVIKRERYGNVAKTCSSILGVDACSLYLYALIQEMPTMWPTRRDLESDFRPVPVQHYSKVAWEWLTWVSRCRGITGMEHEHRVGEFRIGCRRLPVDGWDP